MNRKGKIILGLLEFLLWGGWLMIFPWIILWADKGSMNLDFAIAMLWGCGGIIATATLGGFILPDLFKRKFSVSPISPTLATPKIDLKPPINPFEYGGENVQLPEKKKEEERIINPWQNRVTAGGE